jgi:hypothetical protein
VRQGKALSNATVGYMGHPGLFVTMLMSVAQAARLAEAKRAHLCGMAAKLAYEDPLTIADSVTHWGFTFLTDQKVPSCFLLPLACSLA